MDKEIAIFITFELADNVSASGFTPCEDDINEIAVGKTGENIKLKALMKREKGLQD